MKVECDQVELKIKVSRRELIYLWVECAPSFIYKHPERFTRVNPDDVSFSCDNASLYTFEGYFNLLVMKTFLDSEGVKTMTYIDESGVKNAFCLKVDRPYINGD